MKNILLGIDFHDKTDELFAKTIDFMKQLNAKLWLLHVAAPDPDFVGFEAGPQSIRDRRADKLWEEHSKISDLTKIAEKEGIDTEGLMIQGATIESILEKSEKLNIDLIIAGYHEHNFFYDTFFGNTSLQIIRKSKIPVLVIPL